MVVTLDLPPATKTVSILLFGGQSNCVGKAKLDKHSGDDRYSEYRGSQSNVWFGGRSDKTNDLIIAPMEAGVENGVRGTFGCEVSMGYKYYRTTNNPVLILKLGMGGTNVNQNWNPYSYNNNWDRDEDDGTAAYLEKKIDYGSRDHMFINFVHNSRLVLEKLSAANIPFELKALFWAQGGADTGHTWEEFGFLTAYIYKGIRNDIGRPNGAPNLPIVDFGITTSEPHLRTGKAYARQLMCDVNVTEARVDFGAPDLASAAQRLCGNTRSVETGCPLFIDVPRVNEIGWDPYMIENPPFPEVNDYSQANFDKVFHWYVDYPNDSHGAYEKKILDGQIVMDRYLRSFEPDTMGTNEKEYSSFLMESCVVLPPAVDNICWVDLRSDEVLQTPCEDLWKDWKEPDPDTIGSGENGKGGKKKNAAAGAQIPWLLLFVAWRMLW